MNNLILMKRLVCFALVMIMAWNAFGDYIELVDGRVIHGTIVEETREAVRIRTVSHGITTTVTYNRNLIAHYVIEDVEAPEVPVKPAAEPQQPAEPEPRGPVIAVIPLHGQIGGLSNGTVLGTFDASMVNEALRSAEQAGAELVILDIHSPGGYVLEMEEICSALLRWQHNMRIIAYPRDAFSAAAIIAMSCRELAVRHDSRIGAAVMVRQDDHGWSAIDAKEASPHHAKQRQFMASSGKPYEIVAAMTILETQLWWSPQGGLSTRLPANADDGWEQLVGSRSILTMTGNEARTWGVADHMAGTAHALATSLGYGPLPNVVMFDDVITEQQRSAQREYDRLRTQFERYSNGLLQLRDGLQAFVRAANSNDREAADRVRGQIRRGQGTVLNVGQTIRRIDRSVLARRTQLPEQVIQQIERDAELLGRIRRLVDSNTADGVNEAVDRFNAVIAGWNELLGD